MERVLTMLPASLIEDLDAAAARAGLSRSAFIRTLLIRELREKGD